MRKLSSAGNVYDVERKYCIDETDLVLRVEAVLVHPPTGTRTIKFDVTHETGEPWEHSKEVYWKFWDKPLDRTYFPDIGCEVRLLLNDRSRVH